MGKLPEPSSVYYVTCIIIIRHWGSLNAYMHRIPTKDLFLINTIIFEIKYIYIEIFKTTLVNV